MMNSSCSGGDTYRLEREINAAFLSCVSRWLKATGEVFVLLRYLRAAGCKDYALCASLEEVNSIIDEVPLGTEIEVFREKLLPLRGTVTPSFIQEALRLVPDGSEYMLVSLRRKEGSLLCETGSMSDTHQDLLENLRELTGHEVAFGACPDFGAPDSADLISAAKGGIDGPRLAAPHER